MRRSSLASSIILTLAAFGCTQRPPETQAVFDAAEAMGGAEAVQSVQALTMQGSGTTYRLGQNVNPEGDLPESQVQSFKREYDLANDRMRTEITSANFLGTMVTQVSALDRDVAFNVGGDGTAQRAGSAAVQERQAEYYHHPVTLLQAALGGEEGAEGSVSNLRQEMGHNVVDVTTPEGIQLALHLDPTNNLPVMITSRGYNTNLGDVTLTTSFSEYMESGGLQLPQVISQKIDDFPAADLRVTHSVGTIGDLAAPAAVASAEEPGAPQANVTVEELAPGVWRLAGQSHHSVLVEFPSYGVLVEAPQNDTRTLAVIAKARETLPEGKPLQYLVNTHHHFDHSGGLRAAVAEGLTIITHEINRPLYEELVKRPHTLMADRLAGNPAELKLQTVTGDEKFELRDGNRVMEVYRIRNDTHNDGMLMVYLPQSRILIEADTYTPPRGGPTAENLLQEIKERGLRVDRIAPIHGDVVPLSELQKTVAG
jgi:glyoxylase-like metal-dependent hydrolase (beta-lactamase superfamily II)